MDVQTFAASDATKVATLITWLNRNTMALVATDWARSLPEEVRLKNPVPAAIAEAYANLRDWPRLKALVAEGDWKFDDFMRLALHARVLREGGENLASRTQWNAAVKAAADRPDALERLVRFAEGSSWDVEKTDLLWVVARGVVSPDWALTILQRDYFLAGNTRGCLNTATRRLELHPDDQFAQNDVASFSLLLDSHMERALVLARIAHEKQPQNPVAAVTYAFALHQHGRTEEGLKLMRGIEEKLLHQPAFAAYFGVLLADGGTDRESAQFLEIAQSGKLLPEERAMIAKARDRLRQRSGGNPLRD